MATTVGDLRKLMTQKNATWTIDEKLADNQVLPRFSTGGDLTKAERIERIPRVDITPFLAEPTSNPFLLELRRTNGFVKTTLPAELTTRITAGPARVGIAQAAGATPAAGLSAGTAASVDWRNRFGWPWLTKIKDQGPCESCWCFSAVGTVEAMARIEHAVWSLRSEGDVHDGMGDKCANTGWPTNAFAWMQQHGAADPGCWPYETTDQPYKPTSDRSGRTDKLAGYVTLTSVQDQKNWLNNVGPISACFDCYDDFFAYGANSGVYHQVSTQLAGGHCIVIVGYDDSKQAWLIRNSWGTGWGMAGYGWFGYGQCNMDAYAKYGVASSSVNPDPWTKRRIHNGNLYESGDGALYRNFEVWGRVTGNAIRHYWRDGSSLAWNVAETQANDCAAFPTVTGTTYNRNFEFVYLTTGNRLHHR
jgi:C1A family cysteine protease